MPTLSTKMMMCFENKSAMISITSNESTKPITTSSELRMKSFGSYEDKKSPSIFYGSMVGRISNMTGGCSSCGRK